MEFYIGGIMPFAGDYAPRDWAFCSGSLVPILENQAMYAVLGVTWGGDGRTNFALPDMRSRVLVGTGQGSGLSLWRAGMTAGIERVQLDVQHLPTHSHSATFTPTSASTMTATATARMAVNSAVGSKNDPTNMYLAEASNVGIDPVNIYSTSKGTSTYLADDAIDVDVTLHGSSGGGTVTVDNTGGGQAILNIQPSLGMVHIIATKGLFPSRTN